MNARTVLVWDVPGLSPLACHDLPDVLRFWDPSEHPLVAQAAAELGQAIDRVIEEVGDENDGTGTTYGIAPALTGAVPSGGAGMVLWATTQTEAGRALVACSSTAVLHDLAPHWRVREVVEGTEASSDARERAPAPPRLRLAENPRGKHE